MYIKWGWDRVGYAGCRCDGLPSVQRRYGVAGRGSKWGVCGGERHGAASRGSKWERGRGERTCMDEV